MADILGSAVAQPITAAYKAYASHGLVVVLGKSFTGTLAHEAVQEHRPACRRT